MVRVVINALFITTLLILVLYSYITYKTCSNIKGKFRSGHELVAKLAPDGKTKAFIWLPELGPLGATISQPYQIWMERLDGDKSRSLVFEADKTDGVGLKWKASDELCICYVQAQITRFKNFYVAVERKSEKIKIYKVGILLKNVSNLTECCA